DSKAYHDSDFATKAVGELFNVNAPVNNSPNNTGAKQLPLPQKAMIWYPYSLSDEFPDLGVGGRCAMGGPVYHFDPALASPTKLPAYYDKALFVYDWMRNWVFAVRLDDNYNYKRMERFMPTNGDFRRPIDMEIGPDGAIYMLEYGSVYGIDNEDARLVRIDYNGGNRAPIAKITARDTIGLAPFKVSLSSRQSIDYDEEDQLTYQWLINGQSVSAEPNPSYTFQNNGIYKAILKVTDPAGLSSSDTVEIKVGNTLPKVAINISDNSTFFFNKSTALHYTVDVKDNEDVVIDKKRVKVSLKYIPKVANTLAVLGHQQVDVDYNLGKNLIANSDCKACHQFNAKSVGPSFMAVSKKYVNDKNAIGYLANKIIIGGGGVWGEHAMSAHPQLSKEDAMEIAKYVLSASTNQDEKMLPQQGAVVLTEHVGGDEEGRYILTASYTDKGGAITPLTNKDVLVLRPAKVQAESADAFYNLQRGDQGLNSINNRSYFVLKNIDLKDVDSLTYRYASSDKDATVQVHIDSLKGQVISTLDYKATGAWNKFSEPTAAITNPGGKHDLYFVFVKMDEPNKNLARLDWVKFVGGREVVIKPAIALKEKPDAKNTFAKNTSNKTLPAEKKTSGAGNKGRVLMAKSDCTTCHSMSKKLVGPSFAAIAKRYNSSPAVIGKLAGKIINGGAGSWGQIPMTPHPQISRKDASEIVTYILSLKK
ncbi:MAG: carbohydrate-binding protein, partial [Flavisolibacter sp.]|nr:carbohydrate-binding protein [Flavisolibacter sp.]